MRAINYASPHHERRPSWWGPLSILPKNIVLGAFFSPNELLETHLAPFLDKLSAFEQKNNVFWPFLTKTKQDQVLPSYVHGKIWPHSTQLWLGFFLLVNFFGTPCIREKVTPYDVSGFHKVIDYAEISI